MAWRKSKKAKVESSYINFTLDNGKTVVVKGTRNSIGFIQEQLAEISKKDSVSLQYLFDTLKVPINVSYEKAIPSFYTEIINNSEIPIITSGQFKITKNNSEIINNKDITYPTIPYKGSINMQNIISDKDLTEGTYIIEGNLKVLDVDKPINASFEVKNYRDKIIIILSVFIVVYFLVVLVILIKILFFLKKRFIKKG